MRDGEPIAEAAAAPDAGPKAFSPDAIHLMRTAQTIQYQLSQMADQKASLLLGITFVIFTLSLGQARAGAPPTLPVLILGGSAFLAATLTVMAVLPSVRGLRAGAQPNILFFGAFTRMDEEAFVEALLARLGDTRGVYVTMARDIYQNGQVLADKKYRLLVWAYRVLLAGLFLSLAAFVAPYLARWAGL